MQDKVINVWTKEKYLENPDDIDLCSEVQVNHEVKSLYDKHRQLCNIFVNVGSADISNPKYYVYAWRTKELPKRFFYVGKGTGARYKHIEKEIQKFRERKHNNSRYERMCMIDDMYGIECEFLLKNLTEYEALIYEQCIKLEYIENGEVLLNVEGIPQEYLPKGWNDRRSCIPQIVEDSFLKRYLNEDLDFTFDIVVKEELLRTWFYGFAHAPLESRELIKNDYNIIEQWIAANNGRIYSEISTRTQSIVVHSCMPATVYVKYHKKGIKIFSSTDVLDFIKKDSKFEYNPNYMGPNDVKYDNLKKKAESLGNKIRDFLIELGAERRFLSVEITNGSGTVIYSKYLNPRRVFFKTYEKKIENKIIIPLKNADNIIDRLVNITTWKGDFIFTSIEQLNDITQYFLSIINE